MSALVVGPIVDFYRNVLQPVRALEWFGLSLTSLDVAAAFRLCLALRQVREQLYAAHVKKARAGVSVQAVEPRSFVREASAVLLVVYAGEALTAPFLGTPASFMLSGVVPLLYVAMQALVEALPTIPTPSLNTELPLSFFDGMTRAYLLCSLIPPVVLTHTMPAVSTSPWTLLLTSLVSPNAGFLVVNALSFLQPHALTLTTPPELSPYGWSTTDLWAAPLITSLYALLTHAQPFWADAHAVLLGWLGAAGAEGVKPAAVDPETARAVCAAILATMFSVRTAKNYGGAYLGAAKPQEQEKVKLSEKVKAQ